MIKGESGSVFWRFLIVILSLAVVLAVVIPQLRQQRESTETAICREQMVQLSRAQDERRQAVGTYTDNIDSLQMYLPPGTGFVCPSDGQPYIISALDSTTYTISCPNEHGLVNLGKKSWEKK